MLDLDPYQINADPQPCVLRSGAFLTPGSGTGIQGPGWVKVKILNRIRIEQTGSYFLEFCNLFLWIRIVFMPIRIRIRDQIWISIIIEIWIFLKNNHDNFVLRTFIPSFKKAESDFLPGSKEGSGRGRGRGALRGQRGRGRGAGPPAKVSTPGTYNLQVGTSYFFNMSRLTL
jgi:hypothetical protein